MKKIILMSLLMFAALGCMCRAVSAQDSCVCNPFISTPDRWETQVRSQLRRQALVLNVLADGYIEEAYLPFIRSMRQNQYQDIKYRLVEGVTYVFTGACDNDCHDLDFKLFSDSTKIREDVASDDMPAVVFRPAWTGTYTLRVVMANCNRGPCRYGVSVFK